MITITDQTTTIKFELTNGDVYYLDKTGMSIKKKWGFVLIYGTAENQKFTKLKMRYSEVTSPVVASNDELIATLLSYKVGTAVTVGNVQITDGVETLKIEPNGSMPVTLQDQVTPLIVTKFSYLEASTTTTAANTIGDTTITVASTTSIVAGKLLSIFDPTSIRFTQLGVISILGSVVTIDQPLDFPYPSGSYVDVQDSDLSNRNGSLASPIVCGIRNNAGQIPPPGINLTFDVTRIIFNCFTSTAPILSDFGDITNGLANGLVLRKRDGDYYNIFNVKDNGQIAGIMYDFDIFSSAAGQDGFKARMTFGGQEKFGAVIRLPINEDLEIIIQDNLTTLTKLEIVAEGSIVID
jgi:hypothetical protein